MKKTFVLILALILCLSLCACGSKKDFDQDAYDEYLAGKCFESDGRTLTFDDDDNKMTYNYTNGGGDTFRYTYSITKLEKDGDEITFKLKQVSANENIENEDKDKTVKATYSISDKTVE